MSGGSIRTSLVAGPAHPGPDARRAPEERGCVLLSDATGVLNREPKSVTTSSPDGGLVVYGDVARLSRLGQAEPLHQAGPGECGFHVLARASAADAGQLDRIKRSLVCRPRRRTLRAHARGRPEPSGPLPPKPRQPGARRRSAPAAAPPWDE